MKLKNLLLSGISLVAVAAVAIGGTLAYLTDRDSEANVFTVGNVSIALEEKFEQGAELLPGVKIEKEARITNTGDNDAWVWMTMAVPAALDSSVTTTVGEANALHWNVPGAVWKGYGDNSNWMNATKIESALENGYITEAHLNADKTAVKSEHMWTICQTADAPVPIKQETIKGVEYNVYTFLYNGKLASDETTPVSLHQVYLDQSIDINTDGQWYFVKDGVATKIEWNSNVNGNPMVYVSAYAMQTNEFATVLDAYKAYNTQWADNGTEYADVTVVNGDDSASPAINGTNVAGMITTGGEYNNLIINDETTDYKDGGKYFRALSGSGIKEDLTVNNSYLEGLYAMNVSADTTANVKLSATDTTFDGWVSYSGWASATFTDCTFIGEKTHSDYAEEWVMSHCRVQTYVDTTLTNCNFGENFAISRNNTEAITITINNCYKEGVKITADNFNALLNNEELNGKYYIKATNNVTVIVDGATVTLPNA